MQKHFVFQSHMNKLNGLSQDCKLKPTFSARPGDNISGGVGGGGTQSFQYAIFMHYFHKQNNVKLNGEVCLLVRMFHL
jgi:hypothetical protein